MNPAPRSARPLVAPVRAAAAPPVGGAGWLYTYFAVQIACQLALIVPGLGPFRVVFRSLAFGTSLAMLVMVPGAPLTRHPVRVVVLLILATLGLSGLNPEGASPLARFAHFMFHLSILCPVFWISRLRCDEKGMERLLIIIWAFSTASAVAGVLQATFPGRFTPEITFVGRRNLEALMIQLTDGSWIPRPMGLTDAPGGAASGGFYAALLGIGMAIARPFRYARLLAAGSIVAGMICLYLCQIRSAVVMLGVCVLAMLGIFVLAGKVSRSLFALGLGAALTLGALYIAYALGGDVVTSRLATLVEGDPRDLYYRSRGSYLEHAFVELVPRFPLGAGLGRWGQVNAYFADDDTPVLAGEIQWVAWVVDGGVPLLVLYPLALLVMLWLSVRIALQRKSPRLETWAAILAGYNVGAIALTFSYSIFMSTAGIEFWVINAALIQAAGLTRAEEPAGDRPS